MALLAPASKQASMHASPRWRPVDKVELRSQARLISAAINETGNNESWRQLLRLLRMLGFATVERLANQAIAIEANGGEPTFDGSRRRTLGGIFFRLGKEQAKAEGFLPESPAPPPPLPKMKLDWEQRIVPISQAQRQPGEATTLNITVTGRPGSIIRRNGVVTTIVRGPSRAPSLPKQLPSVNPADTSFALLIQEKQWNRIEQQLAANPDDLLIAKGLPTFDPELQGITVLVQSATTTQLERVREQARAAATTGSTAV